MQEKPTISVILAVYNTKEEYLREAIESILNQTFTNFELIIINDNSTNNAEEVILSYKDDRIKYIKNETNLNAAGARNKGFDIAKGEYIAIMDSDDISVPQRFEKQLDYIKTHPDTVVLGSVFERFNQNGAIDKVLHKPDYDELKVQCIWGCILANPSVFLRKSFVDSHNFRYDPKFIPCEDYNLWSKMIRIGKIENLTEVLLKYRVHDNQISTLKYNTILKNDLITKSELLRFYFPEINDKDALLFARATQEKLNCINVFKLNFIIKQIIDLNEKSNILDKKILAHYLRGMLDGNQKKRFKRIKIFLGKKNVYKELKKI